MSANLFTLAVRNATRKPSRTLLTAGMVVAGTGLLVVADGWITGIFGQIEEALSESSGHLRVVDPDFAARESLMPLYENIAETDPLVAELTSHPEVEAVYPRISAGATVSAGEEIGEHFGLVVGAPNEYFVDRLDAGEALAQGRWLKQVGDELVLGKSLARETGAELGDELVMLGMTQDGSMSPIKGTIVGITSGSNALMNRQVFVSLERARWMVDIPDGAIELLVYTADRGSAAELAEELSALPALADYLVEPWDQREPWASMSGMLGSMRFMLMFVVVFLAALGVWNTMMMSVLERTDEVGVLRAMGMTRLGAIGLFVAEAAAIAVLGGVVGTVLGAIPTWYLAETGLTLGEKLTDNLSGDLPIQSTMYATLTAAILIKAFLLGVVMAILGSAFPAIRAAMIHPVTAMKSGR